ncbi:synaptonemal complex protein 1 [Tachyglossus aculeatus]|uniref:synaptonemal complex protein 1 n=1 Tax=Tachyglossus aculeatus TaxID=9261 RepID=UPI0018F7619A|nr:synaptonemal complex protein 1 [Tachyglossus aculeatus]
MKKKNKRAELKARNARRGGGGGNARGFSGQAARRGHAANGSSAKVDGASKAGANQGCLESPQVEFDEYIEDYLDSHFEMVIMSNHAETMNSGAVSQNVKCLSMSEENSQMSNLYSNLYKELGKIKKWKVNVESDLKQKDKTLVENRNIIGAQRKAIQELQFENEKVSLKLEDGIQENKELLKENNAIRHLCNLLKETCSRSTEKTKKYELEREETKQQYTDIHSNVERMIVAFEDLRTQAENSRLEMQFKVKENYEHFKQLEKDYQKEVNDMEKQVSLLLSQNDEKEEKTKDLQAQLQKSSEKINQLEEIAKQQIEDLKESKLKQQHLLSELGDVKLSLQESEGAKKALDEELQTAVKTLIEFTGEKAAQIEEIKQAKATHSLIVAELECTICSLKDLLSTEQLRSKNIEDEFQVLTLELQKKSAELGEMSKQKNDKEMQLETLRKTLEFTQKLLEEKSHFEAIAANFQETNKELSNVLQIREREIREFEKEINLLVANEQKFLKQVTELTAELEKEKLKNNELTMKCNLLSLEREQMAQEKSDTILELKKLQEDVKNNKIQEEKVMKQIENLEESKQQLRNELESLKEELKKKDEEISVLEKREENLSHLEKQVETKNKSIDELQHELSELRVELENVKKQHEEEINCFQKQIDEKAAKEEKLLGEFQKVKAIADDGAKAQKETDLRNQYKISDVVALMEKHKRQYDKTVEERDKELKLFLKKEKDLSSVKQTLETQLDKLKKELISLKTQNKEEKMEKEKMTSELQENEVLSNEQKNKKIQISSLEATETNCLTCDNKIAASPPNSPKFKSANYGKLEKEAVPSRTSNNNARSSSSMKTYGVKTPLKENKIQKKCKNPSIQDRTNKKRKRQFDFDVHSDSSGYNDRLTLVSEEDSFKKLYSDYPQASRLTDVAAQKTYASSSLKTPGSAMKFGSMKKLREDGWAAVSKVDRKKKRKANEKLFT